MWLLALLVSVALLALAVWWFHRQGLQNRRESVDRSGELPPLASDAVPDFAPAPKAVTAASPVVPPLAVTEFAPHSPRARRSDTTPPPDNNGWQDEVKRLKDVGDLELALALCQQQFPKAQAFQQAAVLLRLQVKGLLERQQDPAPLLQKLYRCAVLADLYRSGAPLKPANARQALKALAVHEFNYQDIGYRQLKLLSKSDCKLLGQCWGEPFGHLHAEAVLGTLWENLCR